MQSNLKFVIFNICSVKFSTTDSTTDIMHMYYIHSYSVHMYKHKKVAN